MQLYILFSQCFKKIPSSFPNQLKQDIPGGSPHICRSSLDSESPLSQQWSWSYGRTCAVAQGGYGHEFRVRYAKAAIVWIVDFYQLQVVAWYSWAN